MEQSKANVTLNCLFEGADGGLFTHYFFGCLASCSGHLLRAAKGGPDQVSKFLDTVQGLVKRGSEFFGFQPVSDLIVRLLPSRR